MLLARHVVAEAHHPRVLRRAHRQARGDHPVEAVGIGRPGERRHLQPRVAPFTLARPHGGQQPLARAEPQGGVERGGRARLGQRERPLQRHGEIVGRIGDRQRQARVGQRGARDPDRAARSPPPADW